MVTGPNCYVEGHYRCGVCRKSANPASLPVVALVAFPGRDYRISAAHTACGERIERAIRAIVKVADRPQNGNGIKKKLKKV